MQPKPDVAATDRTLKHVQERSSQTPKGTGITDTLQMDSDLSTHTDTLYIYYWTQY